MLAVAYVISFLGMIVLPIVLGIYLARKFRLSWKLLLAGALTFIASQILHIPFLYGLTAAFQSGVLPTIPPAWALAFNAIVLGLLAGIFEETARYLLFRFVLRKSNTWNEGVLVGAGHGGIEAILVGLSAMAGFLIMLSSKNSGVPVAGIQPEQVAAYWSTPVYLAFLGLVERIFAVCLHLSLSVMVLYSIVARKPLWFWGALLWHAFVDASAVFLVAKINSVGLEAIVGVMALISLGILFWLRGKFPQLTEPQSELVTTAI